MFLYACAIFIGSFLLFQLQPLIGKYVLPWFGGAPNVWTLCMLFFQCLLLIGYGYAHIANRFLKGRRLLLFHLALLAAALCCLPVIPADTWKPTASQNPAWRILLLLSATVGLPYFLVSTTAPLLQAWFAQNHPHKSPYPLYALSNFASLLALLSYPILFEPFTTRKTQAWLWSGAFVAYVLLYGYLTWKTSKLEKKIEEPEQKEKRPDIMQYLLWIALPACASALLLAVTNQISMNVAPIPFLWVVPLSLYLITFIISFSGLPMYWRPGYFILMGFAVEKMIFMIRQGLSIALVWQLTAYLLGLFICCLILHCELYKLKPKSRDLTAYYLCISAGGAIGGCFVAVIAPLIFVDYFELPLALVATVAFIYIVFIRQGKELWINRGIGRLSWFFLISALLILCGMIWEHKSKYKGTAIACARNFYGTLRVDEKHKDKPSQHKRKLVHGMINHGTQFMSERRRKWGTTYYGEESGAGLVISHFPRQNKQRVGIVGLGTGTLLTYGTAGDYYRVYEINEMVKKFSQKYFFYIKDCQAQYDIIMGDARLVMEKEHCQNFDILLVDAFSSDAIPTHLLTKESIVVYLKHLKKDGVLGFHVSNRYIDLKPVVAALADSVAMPMLIVESRDNYKYGTSEAVWVLISNNKAFMENEIVSESSEKYNGKRILWTDEYVNLIKVLKKKGE